MTRQPRLSPGRSRPVLHDCWNRVGVHGDGSCLELAQHVHCRNCPAYTAAATVLLDGDLSVDSVAEWTHHIAEAKQLEVRETCSVAIFRIGMEWLALPTQVFVEVADQCAIHSVPHRRSAAVLGLSNVRGELLVCVSLGVVLGLDVPVEVTPKSPHKAHQRLLVIQYEGNRLVFPVDEMHGIHRFSPRELQDVPATAARATVTYTKAMLPWNDKAVGCLDEQLLFYSLNRSLV